MRLFVSRIFIATLLAATPALFSQQPATAPEPVNAPQHSAFAQRPPIPQQLAFAPYHSIGIYKVGETVGWTVTPGPVTPLYSYKYTVRRNNAVVLKEGKLDLANGKDTIEVTGLEPEMIYVAVEPYALLPSAALTPDVSASPNRAEIQAAATNPSNAAASSVTDAAAGAPPAHSTYSGGNTGRNNGLYAVGAAVTPLQIGMDTPRPADFDTFWNDKLAEQAKIPINPVLIPIPSDVPRVELSIFNLDALGSHAHGYIAKPVSDGKFPALI